MRITEKIKIAFFGTPDFGLPCLRALIKDKKFVISFVITQPNKKVGRKQILMPTPIKKEAQEHNIPIFQPEKIKNFSLPYYSIDLIITAAYGQIIPQKILDVPKYGAINVHGSLLPKYRGAACIQAAILNGNRKTGITIIKMATKLDAGPIISQREISIKKTDTAGELYRRLSYLAPRVLLPAAIDYIEGKIKPKPQDESRASYVSILKKEDGQINWRKSAIFLERFIRAMHPWPGAFCFIGKERLRLKIIKVSSQNLKINKYRTGEMFLYKKKLAVQCSQNALIIERLQLAGKKEMNGEEFVRGYKGFLVN